MIEQGKLPNLSSLFNDGLTGNLEPCIPPVTYPAWKCYTTGRTPQELGSYYFLDPETDTEEINISFNASCDFDGQEIWDYLSEDGRKSAVINVPSTSPPPDIEGIIASGPMLVGDEHVRPSSEQTTLDALDYQITDLNVEQSIKNNRDKSKLLSEMLGIIKSKFRVGEHYLKSDSYDFVQVTAFCCDPVQHLFWNEWEENGTDASGIPDAWRVIDEGVGNLLAHVSEDDYVMVMSDHGFQRLDYEFSLNTWLERQGYLVRDCSLSNMLYQLGFDADRLRSLLSATGLMEFTRTIVPEYIRGSVPDESGNISLDFLNEVINWQETKAVMCGDGIIYLNENSLSDPNAFKSQLISELKAVSTPDGNPVVNRIEPTEEIYDSRKNGDPHILAVGNEGVLLKSALGESIWETNGSWWRAIHHSKGIFSLSGPGVPNNNTNLTIFDLAPTIIYLLDADTRSRLEQMHGSIIDEIEEL
jgi:predicted AlkP superfamily phosphohydrolase/phosphomutase